MKPEDQKAYIEKRLAIIKERQCQADETRDILVSSFYAGMQSAFEEMLVITKDEINHENQ